MDKKAKQIKWHGSSKCVCRLDPIICNNKQKWNENKCRCECLTNKKVMIVDLIGILIVVSVNTRKKQLY